MKAPFVIARGVQTEVEALEVMLSDGDDRGLGEAAGVSYQGESMAALRRELNAARPRIEAGTDREAIRALLPAGGARNALDAALWDIEAKRSGRPAWTIAGVPKPPPLGLTATLSLDTPAAMAEAARRAPLHTALKLKLGDTQNDLARIECVRAATPRSTLLCDVNGAWSFDDLRRLAPELARLGVALIEQPLAVGEDAQLDGYRAPVSLCADESCTDAASLGSLVGRYDLVNIKLDKAGGLTEALRLAARARDEGLGVFVGCMLCTSLGVAPALLLAGWGRWFDIDGPTYLTRDRQPGLRFDNGAASAPSSGFWGNAMTTGMRAVDELVRADDYSPPPFAIPTVRLTFELDAAATIVTARLRLLRTAGRSDAPLVLDGRDLELVSLRIDGVHAPEDSYDASPNRLTLHAPPADFILETVVRIRPELNPGGLGLFLAGDALVTQCETVGFRRLTYFLDRPDILSLYEVELIADPARYPVLLSNGKCLETAAAPGGRIVSRWRDPVPKPSYLFALVAGRFERQARRYLTGSGRPIDIGLYASSQHASRCDFALDALERAMRWDEATWGVEYDLDLFNVVGVDGFGSAMENKGLNIFAVNELVTSPARTTDDEYVSIEITVAHEYFHNLTGNRITVRDWFQKALKEGLTRFRDRDFSADIGAREMRRLDFVSLIHREQFREDDGPAAHAVQPRSYVQTPDFVTMTVYDKGAEIFRMLRTLAGAEDFRRAADLFIRTRDGTAATLEDFLHDYEAATGLDLGQFRRWFEQAGRPRIRVETRASPAYGALHVVLTQHTPPTPGEPEKRPQHIPVRIALRGPAGEALPGHPERLVQMYGACETITFRDAPPGAIPSVLRDFSAPVTVEPFLAPAALGALALGEDDAFARWRSMVELGIAAIHERRTGSEASASPVYAQTWGRLLSDPRPTPGLLAHLLQIPNEPLLSEGSLEIDVDGAFAARRGLINAFVEAHAAAMIELRSRLAPGAFAPDPTDMAARRLRNLLLLYLCQADRPEGVEAAWAQFKDADNLTDQVGAFAALLEVPAEREQVTSHAAVAWSGNDAAMMHWYRVQAALQADDTAERLHQLLLSGSGATMNDPAISRALTFAFFRGNRVGFHARNGVGYRLLEQAVRFGDARMPERIHWLMPQILEWRRYDPERRTMMRTTLVRLGEAPEASSILRDLVRRALES